MRDFFQVIFFILRCTFLSFGGGNAVVPFIQRETVVRRKWLAESEFEEVLIASNMIPGPSVVETLTYVAIKRLGKWWGSFAAMVAILPHILFALGLFIIAQTYLPENYLLVINASIIPVIIGMILAFSWRYFRSDRKAYKRPIMVGILVFTIGFCLFVPSPWNISSIPLILVLILVFLVEFVKTKRAKKK